MFTALMYIYIYKYLCFYILKVYKQQTYQQSLAYKVKKRRKI